MVCFDGLLEDTAKHRFDAARLSHVLFTEADYVRTQLSNLQFGVACLVIVSSLLAAGNSGECKLESAI